MLGMLRWFPDALALYTLALVIFTAVLAFGGLYQLRALERAEIISAKSADAAKESADIANKTLLAANRPWMSADVKVSSDLTFGTPAAQLTFEISLKNTGNAPGVRVEIYPQTHSYRIWKNRRRSSKHYHPIYDDPPTGCPDRSV